MTEDIARFVHDDPILDSKQAAEYLGLAVHTMSIWRVKGSHDTVLPYIKVGSRIRYRKSTLDNFLASRTRSQTDGLQKGKKKDKKEKPAKVAEQPKTVAVAQPWKLR